ncbi:MAG: metal ABC transporter permease [Cryomorphaceae bacterium]|nr:metal ABC transporter permease [Cryomorphaceae bacterium]
MNTWVLINAVVIALSCSLAGAFLVLRHRAMLTDAISHAVLPGLVIAFLISGSRNTTAMLIGAFVFGFICIFLVEFFRRYVRITDDASIGITFTSLFAIGIILVSRYTDRIDLDQECVLHGEITYSALKRIVLPGTNWAVPQTFISAMAMLIIVSILITIGYRGLKITSFNPDYATSIGVSVTLWHYISGGIASMVTIVSFEAVGAILVIALMVIPAATAWLISKRLPAMLLNTTLLSVSGSIFGYGVAIWLNVSIAGSIAFLLGIQLMMVVLVKVAARRLPLQRATK